MSDMPMPEGRAGAMSRDAVRRLASSWWLFLILGISCQGASRRAGVRAAERTGALRPPPGIRAPQRR